MTPMKVPGNLRHIKGISILLSILLKRVGKWKVRKRISGELMLINLQSNLANKIKTVKSGGLFDFIIPPDFEIQDANGDNIYEVDVEIINLQDGESRIPVVISQNSLVAPENDSKVLEIESIPLRYYKIQTETE